jgi:hypothetical protein
MRLWVRRVLLLMFCLLIGVIGFSWIWSYRTSQFAEMAYSITASERRSVHIASADGVVLLSHVSHKSSLQTGRSTCLGWATFPDTLIPVRALREVFVSSSGGTGLICNWLGFSGPTANPHIFRDRGVQCRGITFPHWFAVCVVLIPTCVLGRTELRHRRARQVGFCRKCSYDLRASKDRCPECGTPIAKTVGPPRSPR